MTVVKPSFVVASWRSAELGGRRSANLPHRTVLTLALARQCASKRLDPALHTGAPPAACPCGACHAAELPEYRATWASRTWRAPTSASLTLTCAPVRVPSKRLHAHTGPDRQNQPRPSILSPPISLLARALHAHALHRVPMQAATLTVHSRSRRSQNRACRY